MQLTTYFYGETNEVVKGLLEQAEIKRQDKTSGALHNTALDSDYLLTILIQLLSKEERIEESKRHLQNRFPLKDGPFFKQSFNVERQSYFGSAIIGNHVHKALQVLKYT